MLNILKERNYIVHVFYFFIPLESQNEQQFVEIELSCLITDYDYSITGVHWVGRMYQGNIFRPYILSPFYLSQTIHSYISQYHNLTYNDISFLYFLALLSLNSNKTYIIHEDVLYLYNYHDRYILFKIFKFSF